MTDLDQQLEQLEALAMRHYPDDIPGRSAFMVRVLTERLRAFHTIHADAAKRHSELRRAGFTLAEIALGSQEVVRT